MSSTKSGNEPDRSMEIARALVDALLEEQRNIHGEYADESVLKSGALARLKYLVNEGFIEVAPKKPETP